MVVIPLARHQDQRLRIIAMYFKSLYSRSDEVVQVAFDSLRESLKDSHRLPKDVLRSGLSPILQTLADPSKLTVVGLDGLARPAGGARARHPRRHPYQ